MTEADGRIDTGRYIVIPPSSTAANVSPCSWELDVSRHNRLVTPPPTLTLSEVDAQPVTARRCGRCANPLPAGARSDALWCSGACRVAALRARRAGRPVAAIAPAVGRISRVDDPAQNHESQSRARRTPRPIAASLAVVPAVDDHEHSPRLCATCTSRRFLELRPAPRARVSAELVPRLILRDPYRSVWPAVVTFGISYRHALAIRSGWRGDRRHAEPIPYRSRGWVAGRRPGWSTRAFRVIPGGRRAEREVTA